MKVLSLFDGMSCGRLALDQLNFPVEKYYASEIDKYAMTVAQKNYPNTIQLGDVKDVVATKMDIDLLIGGSPCTGFSFAGKQLNFFDPQSKLFFEYVRILKECKPKYFFLENTFMKQEYRDVITSHLGVEPIAIESALVSGQLRKRLYWTNIPNIAQPKDLNISFQSILESDQAKVPKAYTLTATYYKKGAEATRQRQFEKHQRPIAWIDDKNTRWLSVLECERLQTLPEGYTGGVSNTQRFKMIGNGWNINTIVHLFKNIPIENKIPIKNDFSYLLPEGFKLGYFHWPVVV